MSKNDIYPFENLPLPSGNAAYEPYIDAQTMHFHHDRHLQTYTDDLNAAIEQNPHLKQYALAELIRRADELPQPLNNTVRNNAGGVFNHRFYFEQLSKTADVQPSKALSAVIVENFGSFDELESRLKKAALSVFGSGYAWLVADGDSLEIVTTANQDVPSGCPLLNIDVWEHAYYIKHRNLRGDYIDDLLRIIDWNVVEARLNDGRVILR